jgi:hypothetical protein
LHRDCRITVEAQTDPMPGGTMAPAPEASIEFPTAADGNATRSDRPRPVITARCLTKNWAKAAGFVVTAAAIWLIVIAILIAV